MSDIKNLFVDTFEGYDLSRFSVSDLKRLGFKRNEMRPSTEQKQERCCPQRKKKESQKHSDSIFNRNKIIPVPPPMETTKRNKYKHMKHSSILEEMEQTKARHKLYYHTHREELKWKRLVKEGRTDLIELLLMSGLTD
jgi:hypothetical protein